QRQWQASQPSLSLCPIIQPIGAVQRVLVKNVSDLLAKLIETARIIIQQQILPVRRERGRGQQVWQLPQQAPDQTVLVQGRTVGNVLPGQHGTIGTPQKPGRKADVQTGCNAQA